MKLFFVLTLAAVVLVAQAPAGKPEFEVASVRAAAPLAVKTPVGVGIHLDGAQARIASFTLKDLVGTAYRTKAYAVSGPDWTGSDRFDLVAKMPAGATSDQLPEMLQALLADRFQLKFHREKRELPVYALVMGKTPFKLTEVPSSQDVEGPLAFTILASGGGAGVSVDLGQGCSYTLANDKFEGKKLSMDMLALTLERYTDRPIVNLTELKGKYDVTLDVTQEDYRAMLIRAAVSEGLVLPAEILRLMDANTPTSLMDSLQRVGLKLESRKAPLDVLVVDQARKTPTDN